MAVIIKSPPHASAQPCLRLAALLALSGLLLLSGCDKPPARVEEVRPVRAITLRADHVGTSVEFPGEVRARVESRLGFRVGGKIIARKVDVGSVVKRGQVLMQLDPQDLKLAQMQANAALRAAESNLALAKADLKRYKELQEKNFVSRAVLESKETAFKAAEASYQQALAAYRNQSNQTGYANLVSDVDGVVTGVDAEAGQVVAAGAPVVRVAESGEKEIVIGIPEDKVDRLRSVSDVQVRTWAQPDQAIPGKLRELSPVADPATRTYTARISIPDAPDSVKLGMTAYVTFSSKAQNPMIRLPLTALRRDGKGTAVWVVDGGTVKLAPIKVAGTVGNQILVAEGLAPGQSVVTAGVHLLQPGQKVKLLDSGESASKDGQPASGAADGAAK